jgi:hypothetical protein
VQTVGQLVGETLKLYGSRFLLALPLGLPLAFADQLWWKDQPTGRPDWGRTTIVLAALSPAFTLAYLGASVFALRVRPSRSSLVSTFLAGSAAFALGAPLLAWYVILGVAWLAIVGHVVPAGIGEQRGVVAAFRRSLEVARADYVHAFGGLATLVVLFYLTRVVLGGLLRSQADNTARVAVFLADLVVSPIIPLGGALLFLNLAARVGTSRVARRDERARATARIRSRPPAE